MCEVANSCMLFSSWHIFLVSIRVGHYTYTSGVYLFIYLFICMWSCIATTQCACSDNTCWPWLVKVVINAVEGRVRIAARRWCASSRVTYLNLEPWQWKSFTAIMIIRYSRDKIYSVSYAIRLYIDRSYYHLLHRSPSQSKSVAIKAYRNQGCTNYAMDKLRAWLFGLLVCLAAAVTGCTYLPMAYCGSRL
jgi:hypothetical protein